MVHFVEEIWRFKGLGLLWAILIALIIVGMREAAKRIENRNIVAGIFVFGIGCFVLISILIFRGSEKTAKPTTKEPDLPIDTVVSTNPNPPTYEPRVDTTILSCEFLEGRWKVVSTDEGKSINTIVKFECVTFYERVGDQNISLRKILVEADDWRLRVAPNPGFKAYSFESQDNRKIKLDIKRLGGRMEGELQVIHQEGIIEKKEILEVISKMVWNRYGLCRLD